MGSAPEAEGERCIRISDKEVRTLEEIRTILFVVFLGTFVFRITTGASALLDETVLWKLGYSIQYIVVYGISFSIVEGMIAGSTGYAVDIYGAKKILVASAIMGTVAMLIYYSAVFIWPNRLLFYIWLLTAQMFEGITSSLKVTPTAAVIARYSPYETRSFRMGLWDTILMFGRIIGVALAGFLYGFFTGGDDSKAYLAMNGFLILALMMTVVIVIYWVFLPDIPPEKEAPPRKVAALEMIRHVGEGARVMFSSVRRDLGLTWLTMSALWGLAFTLGPIIIMSAFGAGGEETGYITAIIIAALALPAPIWGKLADKFGRKRIAVIGITGLLLTVILGATAYFVLKFSTSDPKFYLVVAPGAVLISAIAPSFLGRLADTAIEGERGITMSGYQFITSMGEVTGVVIGGLMWLAMGEVMQIYLGWQYEYGAALGVGIAGLTFFLLTMFFGYRLRSDEEVLRLVQELQARKAREFKSGSANE